MHCPQCGQQFFVGVRFCKSCGFALDGIRELLTPTDISPTSEKETHKVRQSRSRKGLYRGVIILSIGIVALSLSGVKSNIYPLLILICGLMRILYAMIFQEDTQRKKKRDQSLPDIAPITNNQLGAATLSTALPLSQTVPVSLFSPPRMDTADMVNSPSVTEHTTKFLDESQDPK
jgi:hypothetical protein